MLFERLIMFELHVYDTILVYGRRNSKASVTGFTVSFYVVAILNVADKNFCSELNNRPQDKLSEKVTICEMIRAKTKIGLVKYTTYKTCLNR
jgi:hypothetical protein